MAAALSPQKLPACDRGWSSSHRTAASAQPQTRPACLQGGALGAGAQGGGLEHREVDLAPPPEGVRCSCLLGHPGLPGAHVRGRLEACSGQGEVQQHVGAGEQGQQGGSWLLLLLRVHAAVAAGTGVCAHCESCLLGLPRDVQRRGLAVASCTLASAALLAAHLRATPHAACKPGLCSLWQHEGHVAMSRVVLQHLPLGNAGGQG